MQVNLKVTNETLYNLKVKRVNFSKIKCIGEGYFEGMIEIYMTDDSMVPFYGLMDKDDFKSAYGFTLAIAINEQAVFSTVRK